MKTFLSLSLLSLLATSSSFATVTVPADSLFGFDFSNSSQTGSGTSSGSVTPATNTTGTGWYKYGDEQPTLSATGGIDNSGYATFATGGPYTTSTVSIDTGYFSFAFSAKNILSSNSSKGAVFIFGDKTLDSTPEFRIMAGTTDLSITAGSNSGSLATIADYSNVFTNSWNSVVFINVVASSLSAASAANSDITEAGTYLYINGVLAGHQTLAIDLGTVSNSMQIGGRKNGPGSVKLNGDLDDVYMFNRALSATEIQGLAGIPEPSTYALGAGMMTLGLLAIRRRMRNK